MLRSLVLVSFFSVSAWAAIWPEHLGQFERKAAAQVKSTADSPLTREEGLQFAEEADYGTFRVVADKFKDSIGAYAASLDLHNPQRVGNLLVSCTGACPEDLLKLAAPLATGPRGAPLLAGALPSKGQVPNSEHYILGPVGLRQNAPQIPESAVAFQFETEGDVCTYRSSKGEQMLAVFTYPTMQMARQQTPGFEAIPGATVKRTDSVIAVVLPVGDHPVPSPADAQALLSAIHYQSSVEPNETPPLQLKPETAGQMIISIFELAGIVVGFCLLSGLVFAAFRVASRKFGYSDAQDAMTTLHLEGK